VDEVKVERDYYPNGKIRFEGYFKNGIPHGFNRIWYENGLIAREYIFKEGVPDGISRHWDDAGNLLVENNIINGTGIEKVWNPETKSWSEFSWVNGECTGRFRTYWADGTVIGDVYWIRNKQVSKKKYIEMCQIDDSLPKYEDLKTEKKKAKKQNTAHDQGFTYVANDSYYEKLFSENTMIEALSWLNEPDVPERTLGECARPEDSIELVKDFYALGAVKVWTFEIDGAPDEEQNSGKLVIELPSNSKKRAKILKKCGEIAEEMGFDAETDMGQKYVLVMLD